MVEDERQVEANKRQIGGDHYRSKFQHWDLISRNNVPYLEGTATKYIARWRKAEEPLEDLEKCVHYIDKILDEHKEFNYSSSSGVPMCSIHQFFEANPDIESTERTIFINLLRWWRRSDLEYAKVLTLGLIGEFNATAVVGT